MNSFQFANWITTESLRNLVNPLVVAEQFNTDYNKEFTKSFAVGETVRVKLPQRFLVREGLTYSPQAIDRIYTTVTCDQIFGVDFQWDDAEAALKLERGQELIKKEYIEPAMLQLSQEIDSRAANWAYLNTNNIVGQLGVTPTNMSIAQDARTRLIENACPPGEKMLAMSPACMGSLVTGAAAVFNDQGAVGKAFKEGYYGRARGFDWAESMSLYSHTAGTWAGTVETSSAGQTGSSINLTATTNDTFVAGDVISFEGVYNVNPKTRRTTGTLKQFVITQSTTAAASAATILISPAIIPTGQYQNCTNAPANGADLTLFPGTTSPNGKSAINGLAMQRDAFALVGVNLEMPQAVEIKSQARDPKTGISIRFVRAWNPTESRMINRFDVLMGFGNLYPDQSAVRVLSAT
jgi:hypothetical protein